MIVARGILSWLFRDRAEILPRIKAAIRATTKEDR
jgi:hypothetical protein